MLAITLTTSWNPGSADDGQTYTKCFVCEKTFLPGKIAFRTALGASTGTIGKASRSVLHEITGDDYATISSAESAGSEEVYLDEIDRRLLQWCIDNEGDTYAGTIE